MMTTRRITQRSIIVAMVIGSMLIIACGKKESDRTGTRDTASPQSEATANDTSMKGGAMKEGDFKITSSAFQEGEAIPSKYTCDAENISPPLSWQGAPSTAKSLALIVDDPDAPSKTWVHWVLYNIPTSAHELAEGITADKLAELGAHGGKNDFGKTNYGGPCPPSGTHHYHFKLYALDASINGNGDLDKEGLLQAMKGHEVASTELIGVYMRSK